MEIIEKLNLKYNEIEDTTGLAKEYLMQAKQKFGMVTNLLKVMSNHAALLKAYLDMDDNFRKNSILNSTEQEVVLLTINVANECHYCVAVHSVVADSKKIPTSITDAIRNREPLEDPKLQALREFTEIMLEVRGWADEEDIEDFLNAGYTEQHVLNIVLALSFKTLSNYTNHLTATALDQVFSHRAWD